MKPDCFWALDESDVPEDYDKQQYGLVPKRVRYRGKVPDPEAGPKTSRQKRNSRKEPTKRGTRPTDGGSMLHVTAFSFVSALGSRAPGGIIHASKSWHAHLTIGWDEQVGGPMPWVDVSESGGIRGEGMEAMIRIFVEGVSKPLRNPAGPWYVQTEQRVVVVLDTGGGRPGDKPHLRLELHRAAMK